MLSSLIRAWNYFRSSPEERRILSEMRRIEQEEELRQRAIDHYVRTGEYWSLSRKQFDELMPPADEPTPLQLQNALNYQRFLRHVAEFDKWYARHVPPEAAKLPGRNERETGGVQFYAGLSR